jgi:hypothetical protein
MRWHWLAGRFARISAVVMTAGALTGVGPGPASAPACVDWTGSQPANPGGSNDSLNAVSVLGRCDVWAVGSQQVGTVTQSLVEHWTGLAWTVVQSNPTDESGASDFFGVAVRSPADAWAVGAFLNGTIPQTLIERPVGRTWVQIASPDPGGLTNTNDLFGVAITSARNAWAVGYYRNSTAARTLIEHWNGRTWRQVRSPNASSTVNVLDSVAAISATDAWAVGAYINANHVVQTLIEHWNGTAWKRVPSPDAGGSGSSNALAAVAANSASNAWAVGHYFRGETMQSLFEHWNGKTWKHVNSPSLDRPSVNGSLIGVTIVSAMDAWAVGSPRGPRTLAAHWNGKTWTKVPSPDLGSVNEFAAVASSSASNVWMVGSYSNGGPEMTFAMHCC